jgi:hypothetical protein
MKKFEIFENFGQKAKKNILFFKKNYVYSNLYDFSTN